VEEHEYTCSLTSRFKLIFYLSNNNEFRNIYFAKHFAKDLKLVYVTLNNSNLEAIKAAKIDTILLNNYFAQPGQVNITVNNFILSQKIRNIIKKRNIEDYKVLFFFNDINFMQIISKFPSSKSHFDCCQQPGSNFLNQAFQLKFFSKVNSITTKDMHTLELLKSCFKSVFRVPDGIDYEKMKFSSENNNVSLKNNNLFGCYSEEPAYLDSDFIDILATTFPDYDYYYSSLSPKPLPKTSRPNVIFSRHCLKPNSYKGVLIPSKSSNAQIINNLFYSNLFYNAPFLMVDHHELSMHQELMKYGQNKNDLIHLLSDVNNIASFNTLEKNILKENSNWEARANQVISAILSTI
jgi:hypothetical protein